MQPSIFRRHLSSITESPFTLHAFEKAGRLLLCAGVTLLSGLSMFAATLPINFVESQIASGLTNPTAMAFAPDGRLFVCQQGGLLRVIKNGILLPTPFVSLTVDSAGERGLLGIAFDPNFATNHVHFSSRIRKNVYQRERIRRFRRLHRF